MKPCRECKRDIPSRRFPVRNAGRRIRQERNGMDGGLSTSRNLPSRVCRLSIFRSSTGRTACRYRRRGSSPSGSSRRHRCHIPVRGGSDQRQPVYNSRLCPCPVRDRLFPDRPIWDLHKRRARVDREKPDGIGQNDIVIGFVELITAVGTAVADNRTQNPAGMLRGPEGVSAERVMMKFKINITKKFKINGQEYHSIEEIPENIRQAYERAMGRSASLVYSMGEGHSTITTP